MNPLTVLALFKRFGWPVAFALLACAYFFEHSALTACRRARELDAAHVAQASATALADDLNHARLVEHHDATVAKETQDAVELSLGSARAAIATHARLHSAPQAPAGGSGATGVPIAANPTGSIDPAPAQAVVSVDDLNACGTAAVVAQGWQDWWTKVSQQDGDR